MVHPHRTIDDTRPTNTPIYRNTVMIDYVIDREKSESLSLQHV